jgi:hypothetical protein
MSGLINEDDTSRKLVAYHGTKHKIDKFKFVNAPDARNQEGPGIYFTINQEDAKRYAGDGGYVYTVELSPKRLLRNVPMNKVDKKELRAEVTNLIKMAPNWKTVAMEYGESLEDGLDGMLYQYIDSPNVGIKRKVFTMVFEDLYKGNPEAYIKNMVRLGYDAVFLKSKDGLRDNYAVYNPSIIKLVKTEQV